ncbi:NADH-ubiquinone oxidoreductase-F iron-sulfur binding region domain-containing protein [Herbiconiux sp. A18JL235]|uniref:NADH-ubiquinone oxidoreductase-F iron-sulfur binding region domain-containing protein n=1 Tax=Herbiconiux sp. A18JL235 TaxID=3152363 RepID=A0AB39BBS8_9MICO
MTSTNAATTAMMPPEGTLPSRLFAAGHRADAARHVARFGPVPVPAAADLVMELRASGLTGRGGGAFPASKKIDALAGPPGTIIANGSEGEPLSRKDATLLEHAPHLVIDGLVLLSAAVGPGARLVVVAHPDGAESVRRALLERRDGGEIEVRVAEDRFVAGEATAVVAGLSGAPATPKDHPVHLTERGVGRRPTLLFNVETLAHIALIARYGAEWFRSSGTADDPGTRLFSISGDGVAEQVVEVPGGSRLAEVLTAIGVEPTSIQAALVGGFHGRWIAAGDFGGRLVARPADGNGNGNGGIAAGAGVVLLLGAASCGLRVSASILDYLAAESAGQCGPCVLGLPRLSHRFAEYSSGRDSDPSGVRYLIETIPGRGACHHPDGTVSLARSALAVFAGELDRHRSGSCSEGGLA